MMPDNALADCKFSWRLQSGDTGRRGTEHRSFNLLWFAHNIHEETDHLNLAPLTFCTYFKAIVVMFKQIIETLNIILRLFFLLVGRKAIEEVALCNE